jgi:toxin ParE1/3/4
VDVPALLLSHKRLADGTHPQSASGLRSRQYLVLRRVRERSVEIADRLIDSITERFLLLANLPNIGRRRDDDLRPGLRSFPVGEYVIIYRLQDEDVLVLRVLRGSRNIQALFAY